MRTATEEVLREANNAETRVSAFRFVPTPSVEVHGSVRANRLTSAVLAFQTAAYAMQSEALERGQAIARVEYSIVNTRDKQFLGYFNVEVVDALVRRKLVCPRAVSKAS